MCPVGPAGLSSDSGLGGSTDGSGDALVFGSVVDSVTEEGGWHTGWHTGWHLEQSLGLLGALSAAAPEHSLPLPGQEHSAQGRRSFSSTRDSPKLPLPELAGLLLPLHCLWWPVRSRGELWKRLC